MLTGQCHAHKSMYESCIIRHTLEVTQLFGSGVLGSWCPLLWCVEWGIQDKMAEDVQSLQGLEEWLKQCAIYYVKSYVSEHSHKVSPVKNSA